MQPRETTLREIELMIARGRARETLKHELREDLDNVQNRPQLPLGYDRVDDFAAAAERLRVVDEAIAAIEAAEAEELAELDRRLTARRRSIRIKQKAAAVLKATEHLARGRRR
jgi:hypothetical protein